HAPVAGSRLKFSNADEVVNEGGRENLLQRGRRRSNPLVTLVGLSGAVWEYGRYGSASSSRFRRRKRSLQRTLAPHFVGCARRLENHALRTHRVCSNTPLRGLYRQLPSVTLGAYERGGNTGRDRCVSGRPDKGVRATDEDLLRRRGQPAEKFCHHVLVDAAAIVVRAARRLARQRKRKREAVIACVEMQQFFAEQHLLERPGGKEEEHRHIRAADRPLADHRHEGHDAGSAGKQQERSAVADLPDEIAADRPAQFDRVPDRGDIMKEGRDLAVVETLNGQLDHTSRPWRRGNRVAALGPIAIGGGQSDVHVLARPEREGTRKIEEEALDARRLRNDRGDRRLLPLQTAIAGGAAERFSHRRSAARAKDRRRCGSRGAPRSRARLSGGTEG